MQMRERHDLVTVPVCTTEPREVLARSIPQPRSHAGDDPRTCAHAGHVEAGDRVARADTCAACHGYIKTFDLRAPGTKEVVPLVDDVATLPLDLWAQDRGFTGATLAFAGV
jgi:hypothetical protein